jgi:hypothetical protein
MVAIDKFDCSKIGLGLGLLVSVVTFSFVVPTGKSKQI